MLKQATKSYVNRVILLSDGNANSGITDHDQLMKVVDDYQTARVAISTIGVSHFDEDIMEGIDEHGKGTFYFIDQVEEIPNIFAKELEGLLSVVAQNATLSIKAKDDVRIHKVERGTSPLNFASP
ncbi:VWA domain-containing protein [Bacillus sp. DJP31]|uniref:VWA domain-containing protein n=1 Tax=Bacillus sp. DJP31 TaxID=3409789 RepID=UPI003BB5D70A